MGHQYRQSNNQYSLPGQDVPGLKLALSHPNLRYNTVKREPGTPSPDLSPSAASLQQYQFQFRPSHSISGHTPSSLQLRTGHSHSQHQPLYRFGSDSPLHTAHSSWPSSTASPTTMNPNVDLTGNNVDLTGMQHTMSFDEYEDADELAELPPMSGRGGATANEKTVRRRSSKGTLRCRTSLPCKPRSMIIHTYSL